MRKNPLWFYVILLLIPFLAVVTLEFGLRLFSYGVNLEQWIEISEGKLILNPDIGAKYFSETTNYPHSNHDSFDKIKKESTLRVFVLGGSTTAGFPFSPSGAFSRYIRERMQIQYPNKNIEVVNLGITAINSYSILDFLPGVIVHNPDLVIIYAGHNEYYGALGVGSTESIGNSQFLVRFYLALAEYKTFQLVNNIIKTSAKIFNNNETKSSGTTLMARMAEEKSIPYNSDIFDEGVKQFENNLESILKKLKNNNIPTIIGTLVSNIKDQKPFVSIPTNPNTDAVLKFEEAGNLLKNENITSADSLYRLAKDLDGLRFRAPEKFNEIIKSLSRKYNISLVDVDLAFSQKSKNKIVGNNLMVDHLHPNLEGYKLMGEIFSKKIEKILTPLYNQKFSDAIIDSLVSQNFTLSKLDSTIANFTILNLLNDWPFVLKKNKSIFEKLSLKDRIDTLAYKVVKENYNWEIAHQEAYNWFLENDDIENFILEIKSIHLQYPFKINYLSYAAKELIKNKDFKNALYFLEKMNKIEENEFSVKWLGNIYLFNNKNEESIKYFLKAITYNEIDAQVYFNLTIAYLRLKNKILAEEMIRECIRINPDYPNAKEILMQIQKN